MAKRLVAVSQAMMSLMLALSVCGLGGCAGNARPVGSSEASADTSGQATEAAEATEDVTETEPIVVPDGCLDRKGNITVLALAELPGDRLVALLAQQGYAWSERNQLWAKEDGSAAFVALDAEGRPLDEEQVAALGEGMDEASVSYRLVASNYATPKRAFDRLAGGVLEVEDVTYADTSAVGVLHDDEARRCLVFVSTGKGVHVVNVYPDGAVEAGIFAEAAGLDGATSVDAAFERLAGRLPGAES